MIDGLVNGISQQIPTLIPLLTNALLEMVNAFVTGLPMLINTGLKLILAIVQGVSAALPQLIANFQAMIP